MRIWEDITKPLSERRLDYLNYTVDYYTIHGNKRAINENGGYNYLTDDGRKCAIGKDIPDDLCKKFDKKTGNVNDAFTNYIQTVDNSIIFNELPEILKSLGQDFLWTIQNLHDNDVNWISDKNILSKPGLSRIHYLKTYTIYDK